MRAWMRMAQRRRAADVHAWMECRRMADARATMLGTGCIKAPRKARAAVCWALRMGFTEMPMRLRKRCMLAVAFLQAARVRVLAMSPS